MINPLTNREKFIFGKKEEKNNETPNRANREG